jgi:hypothetical protein
MISISPSSTFLTYVAFSPAYGVYSSQLIRYARACLTYDQFLIRGSLLTNNLMSGVSTISFTGSFSQMLRLLQRSILVCQYNLPLGQMLSDVPGLMCLPELELGLTAGVTGRQGMFTPSSHLIPPLVYPEVRVCPILWFAIPTGLMGLMTVRYLRHFIFLMVQYMITSSANHRSVVPG